MNSENYLQAMQVSLLLSEELSKVIKFWKYTQIINILHLNNKKKKNSQRYVKFNVYIVLMCTLKTMCIKFWNFILDELPM